MVFLIYIQIFVLLWKIFCLFIIFICSEIHTVFIQPIWVYKMLPGMFKMFQYILSYVVCMHILSPKGLGIKQSFAVQSNSWITKWCETKLHTIFSFCFSSVCSYPPSFHNSSSYFFLITNRNKMKTSTFSLLAFLGSIKCSLALQREFYILY